ncbi:MAG: methyltransferase domain-containing protein [Spirochaetes bacterium]|nr:methyltransferase domain-containing protein [Spirochaetota bacterium]
MTDKAIITEHFSNTASVWKDNIYKLKKEQGKFEYFDKQYRFDYTVEMIPMIQGKWKRAMDMGCGAGQLLPVLFDLGYKPYGIDISSDMVDLSKKLCSKYDVKAEVKVGDTENLDYPDNYFDLYVAMGVIEYMDEDEPMLKEIMRVLCPGGLAIITTRNVCSIHVRWRTFYRKYIEQNIKNLIRVIIGRKPVFYRAISREHNPDRFKRKLQNMSFKILDERYAHFHTLFAPLNSWFSPIEAVFGKIMEKKFNRGRFSFLASSFIVKVQKPL